MILLPLFVLILSTASVVNASTLADEDFDSLASKQNIYDGDGAFMGYGGGLDYLSLETSGCRSGKCAKIAWPQDGSHWFPALGIAANAKLVHVRFSFKYAGAMSPSTKFLKLFDGGSTVYASATFNYPGYNGKIGGICSGDGVTTQGDGPPCSNFYTTPYPTAGTGTGTIVEYSPELASTSGFSPASGQWHTFEAIIERNSDSSSDGYLKVWIDASSESDVTYELTGWKMRHNSTNLNWSHFNLGDYINTTAGGTHETWFDDIFVTDTATYIGPADGEEQTHQPTGLPLFQ